MEKTARKPKALIAGGNNTAQPFWAIISHQQNLLVVLEPDPANVLARWEKEIPDVIIVDQYLPGTTALELIRELRAVTITPIIIFTEIVEEAYILEAFRAGVDDCIAMPASIPMIQAKIGVWLRRSWNVPAETLNSLRIGIVQLLPPERLVIVGDRKPVQVTNLELRLLYSLMSMAGHTVKAEDLILRVWGTYGGDVDHVMLKNVVYRLRKKIETDPAQPNLIQTVPGLGYRLVAE